jgi:hypothetical protein
MLGGAKLGFGSWLTVALDAAYQRRTASASDPAVRGDGSSPHDEPCALACRSVHGAMFMAPAILIHSWSRPFCLFTTCMLI